MINCQYQRRRRARHEVESGCMPPDVQIKEDPPPEYELPPTYTEAVLKPFVSVQLSKDSLGFEHSSHLWLWGEKICLVLKWIWFESGAKEEWKLKKLIEHGGESDRRNFGSILQNLLRNSHQYWRRLSQYHKHLGTKYRLAPNRDLTESYANICVNYANMFITFSSRPNVTILYFDVIYANVGITSRKSFSIYVALIAAKVV
jgi:hypothetical protein